MKISVHYSPNDATAYYTFIVAHPSQKHMIQRVRLKRSTIFAMFIGVSQYFLAHSFLYGVLSGFISLVVAWFYLSRRTKNQAFQWMMQNHKKFTDRIFSLDQKGLKIESESTETILKWEAIREIAETPTHLFVGHAGQGFYLLPRAAFPSLEDSLKSLISGLRR